ncbi:MAG TPA: TRAP transporter small permease subunit [Hyphomicrobiaceae bacterium]|nr:TRAP transporter small permease subunit [Hyphomicrobiaceae bacterium]
MRQLLDRLYLAAGWLSAICFMMIALMVTAQLIGRVVDMSMSFLGMVPYGFIVEGLAEIAGYLLATASLLALGLALKSASHIRITLVLGALGPKPRWYFELFAIAVSAAFAIYMTLRMGLLAYDSWVYNEVSFGLVPVPLAYPQAAMTLGLLVFSIALIDELVITFTTGKPSFVAAEDAIALGKEG